MIQVYTDWASEKGRKSVGGYIFYLGGAAVSWASRKQTRTLVALSTEEAECRRKQRSTLDQITPIGHRVHEPGKHSDYHICGQSICAEACTDRRNYGQGQTLRHTATAFERQQIKGTITFEYTKSANNTADILTKALPLPAHQRHLEGLGLRSDC